MIKKIGFPLIALTAVLAFAAPKQADARVRFGVAIGGGPVYAGPAPYVPYAFSPAYNPYYADPYATPYPAYVAPAAPVYVGPSVGVGFGWGGGYGYGYNRPAIVNRGYGGGFRGGHGGFRGRR
jgi:hypothetical protein